MSRSLRCLCCLTLLAGIQIPFGAFAAVANVDALGFPAAEVCSAQPPLAASIDADAPGRWNNPERPGTGWELNYADDKSTVDAIWYSFRGDGHPEWLSTGPVQWTVEGWPVGVSKWTGPLLRHGYMDGQPAAPEAVGAVAFRRFADDPTRLAVRWQMDGQAQFEEECLVDRSEVGFGGASLDARLARGWSDPASLEYRVQWVVEPSRNGNSQQWRERPDLLTFSADGAPIWLTAHAHVSIPDHASAQQNFQYRYFTGAYPGGRPTQAAAAQCAQAPQGCTRSRGIAGRLTRTAVSAGSIDWSLDVRRIPDVPQSPDLVRENVQAEPTPEGTQVRIDRVWCSLLPEYDTCPVPVQLLSAGADVEVVRVDLNMGASTSVTLGAEGLVLDELPVGRYRYEVRSLAQRSQAKSSEEEAGSAASLEIEVSESEVLPPELASTSCASTSASWPATGPDLCEDDDAINQSPWYFTAGTFFRHNFDHGVDHDWKSGFMLLANYGGMVRFEPAAPGVERWGYELRLIGSAAPPVTGTLGAFWYQNILIPARPDKSSYNLKIHPLDAGIDSIESRYTLSWGYGYNPVPIGADSFEPDNGYASAKPIHDGDHQIRNFHATGDKDWIKLTLAPGDIHTLTFEPDQPPSGSGQDPWQFKLFLDDGSTEVSGGGFRNAPVSTVIDNSAGTSTLIRYVEVSATNTLFHGTESVYTVDLDVVSTIQPDQYEAGTGDNTRETATPLQPGVQQLHNFHTGTDRDWMSYTPAASNTTVYFNIAPQVAQSTAPKFVAQLWTLDEMELPVQIGAAQGGYATFGYPGLTLSQVSTRANQPYWLEMYSNDSSFVGNPTTYGVTLTTAAGYPLDQYEPDDTEAEAQLIPANQNQLHNFHHVGDQDWYKISVGPNQTATFTLTPTTTNGSNPWSWQSYRDTGSGASALTSGSFGGGTGVVTVAHSGGAGSQSALLRVFRNPAVSGFQGDPSRYTARASVSGGAPTPVCTLSDWSGQFGSPLAGSSAHNPPVKTYFGTCGVQMSTIGSYLVDQRPAAESTYNPRFYYYTGDRVGGMATIFQALTGDGTVSIQVQHDGNALSFSASGVTQNVVVADGAWYEISLQWRAGNDSGPGSLGISVTGNGSDAPLPVSPITGLNNANHRIEMVRLGLISGSGSGTVGFDEFQARRITVPKRLCRGDAVPDGERNQFDIDAINAQMGGQAFAQGQADVNEDGVVDGSDVTALQHLINTAPVCP